jgi:hypothetical protein
LWLHIDIDGVSDEWMNESKKNIVSFVPPLTVNDLPCVEEQGVTISASTSPLKEL